MNAAKMTTKDTMRTERIWSGKRFPGSKQVPWIYDHNSDTIYYGPPGSFHDPIFTHLGEKWTSGGMAHLAQTPMTAGAYYPEHALAQVMSGQEMSMKEIYAISAALSASPHLSGTTVSPRYADAGIGSHLGAIALTTPEQARSRILAGQHQSFGYIDHNLYFGPNHSNLTSALINHGIYTWQSLMNAQQVWGWVRKNAAFGYPESHEYGLDINFASDDKYMENERASTTYKQQAEDAIKSLIFGSHVQSFGARRWS